MSDVKPTIRCGETGDRRWSEPVWLGEILADLCEKIGAHGAIPVPKATSSSIATTTRAAGCCRRSRSMPNSRNIEELTVEPDPQEHLIHP
jgi:hypothetical protein